MGQMLGLGRIGLDLHTIKPRTLGQCHRRHRIIEVFAFTDECFNDRGGSTFSDQQMQTAGNGFTLPHRTVQHFDRLIDIAFERK